jgi:transposase
METLPATAKSIGSNWGVDGKTLERAYKDHLSNFRTWEQLEHASNWILLPKNCGTRLSIDETSLCEDLFTILSNKDGHGGKGTVVAMVRGTKASDVIKILLNLPEEQRLTVTEVTMDFSDSMEAIVRAVFPNATIVIDCFHIVKRCTEAIEEIRLKNKREAIKEQKKTAAAFKKKLELRVKARKAYRLKHPKDYKGKKRGRKPMRLNVRFVPEELSNGDTKVELLTRSKHLLTQHKGEWEKNDSKQARADLLFELYPNLKIAHNLICSIRSIFRNKNLDRESAKDKLHGWYQKVADCTLREVKSARDAIKAKEEEVLNYFICHSTNASAESLNSKLKLFRAQLHGVSDLPFFLYRVSVIFG